MHDSKQQLYMADGRPHFVPRKYFGPESGGKKDESLYGYDYSGEHACEYCGGYHLDDGQARSGAGVVRIYRIDEDGTWIGFAAACPKCVYGAYIAAPKSSKDAMRLPFASRIKDIPDLSADQWRLLSVYRTLGDSYADAAGRVPGGDGVALQQAIASWARTSPPKWVSRGAARVCPETRRGDLPWAPGGEGSRASVTEDAAGSTERATEGQESDFDFGAIAEDGLPF